MDQYFLSGYERNLRGKVSCLALVRSIPCLRLGQCAPSKTIPGGLSNVKRLVDTF